MTGSSRKPGIGTNIKLGLMALLAIGVAYGILLIAISLFQSPPIPSFTTAQEDRSVFYRLKAAYMHKDERIEFDIVAACNVRVTGYADGSSSHDVTMAPPFFVKATKDGGAIAQKVSYACRGETTENGEVPKDFLPGAVWFDDAKDLSLGIAYVLEEGFENPHSQLKFLGATISTATRAEWEQFFATISQSLIPIDRYYKTGKIPLPLSDEEMLADPWNREKLALSHGNGADGGCRGYQKFRFVREEERAEIRKLWPASQPRYWAEKIKNGAPFDRLTGRIRDFDVGGGATIKDFAFSVDHPGVYGFPTRARARLNGGKVLVPEVYGLRSESGIPWLTQSFIEKDPIGIDVDVTRNLGRGLFFCYGGLSGLSPLVQHLIPNYWEKSYTLRVDGEPVMINGKPTFIGADEPSVFFERDEYAFILFGTY
jgi:hypothetical protein